ncbi:MAG TPA: N-acetyl sugar amidotransferase [Flavobacteriales bacterium]|nr:N-acetyl sugar amidotransferase [Flavobacteriales bacterium]
MMETNYRVCSRCVMDTSDSQIKFNKDGICNHCTEYFSLVTANQEQHDSNTEKFAGILDTIKKVGKDHEYDCIIGISGGVDSTYLAYLVKQEFGLRPYAVHLDNGWNSKLAVKNIRNILKRLEIDLYTHVIDWEEFKSLQKAYFAASVIDIEAITDHSINAVLYQVAAENNVKYILKGFNNATEKIMPKSWTFNKRDAINIQDINDKYGTIKLSSFPLMSNEKLNDYEKSMKIQTISPFNYIKFDKDAAKKLIIDELGWVDYGGKHYESIFTRFYQGYILPRKFSVDKRKAHYSNLICAGVMARKDALEEIKQAPYDEEMIKEDYEYVTKKLEYSKEEFESILKAPVKSHFNYKTDLNSKIFKKYISPTNPIVSMIKKLRK